MAENEGSLPIVRKPELNHTLGKNLIKNLKSIGKAADLLSADRVFQSASPLLSLNIVASNCRVFPTPRGTYRDTLAGKKTFMGFVSTLNVGGAYLSSDGPIVREEIMNTLLDPNCARLFMLPLTQLPMVLDQQRSESARRGHGSSGWGMLSFTYLMVSEKSEVIQTPFQRNSAHNEIEFRLELYTKLLGWIYRADLLVQKYKRGENILLNEHLNYVGSFLSHIPSYEIERRMGWNKWVEQIVTDPKFTQPTPAQLPAK